MRLVFMGTPDFAVPALRALIPHHEVVGVITAPDRPAGRGKQLRKSAVKIAAEAAGCPVLQPTNLKDAEFQASLSGLRADLFVVVAFRMLPEAVWSLPPEGTINLHASLLPAYRGAAPINRAIMNGEKTTGLSTFFIEKDIDTGAVIDQVTVDIGPEENAGSLHDRMAGAGAELLLRTVNAISRGTAVSVPQKASGALPAAPKIFKEDCRTDWRQAAESVYNHIRGLSPYPTAFTTFRNAEGDPVNLKIYAASLTDIPASGTPGRIVADETTLEVETADVRIRITELQAPGKKRMATADFLRGNTFPEGAVFESEP